MSAVLCFACSTVAVAEVWDIVAEVDTCDLLDLADTGETVAVVDKFAPKQIFVTLCQ